LTEDDRVGILEASSAWGPDFRGYAADVLGAALKDDSGLSIRLSGKDQVTEVAWTPPKDPQSLRAVSAILKASMQQGMRLPDGVGGVLNYAGEPDNCLGPVLLHLHQNAWRAGLAKLAPHAGEVGSALAKPYHARMSLVELLAHIAEGGMLPDWSYLTLHHPTLAGEAFVLPYVAADAVLRNMWGVAEYSDLSSRVRTKFAPAYEGILGEDLRGRDVMLYHSLEESPMGFAAVADDAEGRSYSLLFNAGSTTFTAEDLKASANAEIPMAFAQTLPHKLLGYDGIIPAKAFKDGGTHIHLAEAQRLADKVMRKPNAGIVFPEVDFTALSGKTGLSEDELANDLHRLTAAKLGLEFARVYVEGGEGMRGQERVGEFARGFNARTDALLRAVSVFNEVGPQELRRFFEDGYGAETPSRLRWDLALHAVDCAVLSEHRDAVSDPTLRADIQRRLEGERRIVDKYVGALGEPYDFDGVVGEFRKIYRGIKLEHR
jgi:hypothetical protein